MDNIPERLINKHASTRRIAPCTLSFSTDVTSDNKGSSVHVLAQDGSESSRSDLMFASPADNLSAFLPSDLPSNVTELSLAVSYIDQFGDIFGHRLQGGQFFICVYLPSVRGS